MVSLRRRNLLIGTSVLVVAAAYYQQTQSMATLAAIKTANSANAATFVGRRALVVGATSGIGEGLAKRLAEGNYSVTVVGRSAERGNAIVEELTKLNPRGSHEFMPCNAFLLKNVEETAKAFKAKHRDEPLDALVLTQGMATLQGRTETSEGIDEKLALHFYSRMAFVHELLPELKKAPSPRVLSVLSAGIHSPYSQWKDDPELKTHYSLKSAADAAGFYNDLALDALAKKEPSILFAHAAPGMVSTRWGTEMPTVVRWVIRGLMTFGRSPADCAEYLSQPLLKSDADATKVREEEKGVLLLNQYGAKASKTSEHSDEKANFIWEHARQVFQRAGLKSASS